VTEHSPLLTRGMPGRPLLGTWVKIPAPEVVEVLHLAGLDFVVIDMEHAPIDVAQASSLIALSRALGLPAMVRVPALSEADIKRVLDAGAAGVVVPHVDTVEQAQTAVRFCRFPPLGQRGSGVTGRAGGWGLSGDKRYFANARDSVCVLVQLESEQALAAATEIGSTPGIDGLFIGPADLALSLGEKPGGPRSIELIAAAERACEQAGLALVTATGGTAAHVHAVADRPYQMLVAGNDAYFLGSAAAETVASARREAP
jgi:2-keto-3-deoxy-L-rhamnonate aldolase RhmA